MSGEPLFSVLIPTRGRPEFLARALASLERQTLGAWEAWVVEDGAGEGLLVARSFLDPRVQGVRNRGQGQVAARNTGLALARGRYLLFLDDDDWLLDTAYLHRVRRAQEMGEALVYTGGLLFGPAETRRLEPGEVGPWLLKDNRLLASGTALPRAWMDRLGPLDEAMGHYWDWDLWLRVYRAGLPFRYLKGPGVGIGLHGGNQSLGREAERAFCLERLRAKHGLGPLALKNHAELAEGW
ncbi:hypothetical protein YIM1640_17600 [Thermus oshimai]|uniref:glycosyltransferase family 2 protein n=1 Tax=Thermus oshimai TaxID=56957 RepID=UPI0031FAACF0